MPFWARKGGGKPAEYGAPRSNPTWWYGRNPPARRGGHWKKAGHVRFGPAKGQQMWVWVPQGP